MGDAVHIQRGMVAAEFREVEWRAGAARRTAGEVVDVGGIQRAVVRNLGGGLGERDRGEAEIIHAVRADLDVCQFEEGAVERIFKHREIRAGSIGERLVEGKRGAAAIAQRDDGKRVAHAVVPGNRVGGADGSAFIAVGREIRIFRVELGDVTGAAGNFRRGGPENNARIGCGDEVRRVGTRQQGGWRH